MKESIKNYERHKVYEKKTVKSALALSKEEKNLREAQRKLGWLPLANPYHHGWVKTYELTFPKNANTYDRQYWADIHKLINHTVWCANEDFRYKDWKGKWKELILEPKYLSEEQFKKLDPKFHKVFGKKYLPIYHNGPVLPFYFPVERIYSNFLKEKKYKRIVTHVRENNPEIESKLAYIYTKLYTEGLWRFAYPDSHHSYKNDFERYYKTLGADERMAYDFHLWQEDSYEEKKNR
jgi:hypothetical protein